MGGQRQPSEKPDHPHVPPVLGFLVLLVPLGARLFDKVASIELEMSQQSLDIYPFPAILPSFQRDGRTGVVLALLHQHATPRNK